jgi:drug/metabolite transporter (DMT)-like permease
MDAESWSAMGLLAAAAVTGSVLAAYAYLEGPSAIIGVFDFAYVGFAVLWGVVLFAEVPNALSFAGMALIVLAGTLALQARRRTG